MYYLLKVQIAIHHDYRTPATVAVVSWLAWLATQLARLPGASTGGFDH